jgi:hypothetical protein
VGHSRFIWWVDEKPSSIEVGVLLKLYLSGATADCQWDEPGGRWMVGLPGKVAVTWLGSPDMCAKYGIEPRDDPKCYPEERWFEVWVDEECCDVITRAMDDFTNAVATGFAKLVARRWQGRYEAG